jgi:hypothetical protein
MSAPHCFSSAAAPFRCRRIVADQKRCSIVPVSSVLKAPTRNPVMSSSSCSASPCNPSSRFARPFRRDAQLQLEIPHGPILSPPFVIASVVMVTAMSPVAWPASRVANLCWFMIPDETMEYRSSGRERTNKQPHSLGCSATSSTPIIYPRSRQLRRGPILVVKI